MHLELILCTRIRPLLDYISSNTLACIARKGRGLKVVDSHGKRYASRRLLIQEVIYANTWSASVTFMFIRQKYENTFLYPCNTDRQAHTTAHITAHIHRSTGHRHRQTYTQHSYMSKTQRQTHVQSWMHHACRQANKQIYIHTVLI